MWRLPDAHGQPVRVGGAFGSVPLTTSLGPVASGALAVPGERGGDSVSGRVVSPIVTVSCDYIMR